MEQVTLSAGSRKWCSPSLDLERLEVVGVVASSAPKHLDKVEEDGGAMVKVDRLKRHRAVETRLQLHPNWHWEQQQWLIVTLVFALSDSLPTA